MNKATIKNIIKQTLDIPQAEITDITTTPDGLTNASYFATVNGKELVIRFPGAGTNELVDRIAEKENLLYGTKLGINPALIFFDVESGLKITEKISNPITMTPTLARESNTMKCIIAMFKHLHNHTTPMHNRFELFSFMAHYERLVQDTNPLIFEKLTALQREILELKIIYQSFHVQETPCHIDAVCANILSGEADEFFLIDWEYSGMFDPLWDIATMFLSFGLTEEEEAFFLTYYLEREPDTCELQRILLLKIFQDYFWSLWTFYKEALGDKLGNVGMMRVERAMDHIADYKVLFPEDNVV